AYLQALDLNFVKQDFI
ncbi:putative RING finger protein, partial [Naja naja]